jgi:hypothetical protein
MKRHEKKLVGFLPRPEIDAVLAAPDRHTWAGRRDRVTALYGGDGTAASGSRPLGHRALSPSFSEAPRSRSLGLSLPR